MMFNENVIPVTCPKCISQTLIIKPGDKMYCLNNGCNFCERFPTDPEHEGGVFFMSVNYRAHRYYIRQLEAEVRTIRENLQAKKNVQGVLPCPFCGPKGSMVSCYQDCSGYWSVGCGRCGTHSGMRPPSDPEARQKVMALWNTRPAISEFL
jgi:hypothetical protein